MLDTIDLLYEKYNVLIDENEYSIKYDIPHAHMFVIEGMDKVRDIIERNRKRKLTKHKKLSNNTIIEIDNCSPLEILKLQKNLLQIDVYKRQLSGGEHRRCALLELVRLWQPCGMVRLLCELVCQ